MTPEDATIEEEIELLQRISSKDQMAMAELYDRFSKILFSIAARILRDEGKAQEVLQEVFIQIWDRAPAYNPRLGKPMTWAVVMTRNRSIDALRRQQRDT